MQRSEAVRCHQAHHLGLVAIDRQAGLEGCHRPGAGGGVHLATGDPSIQRRGAQAVPAHRRPGINGGTGAEGVLGIGELASMRSVVVHGIHDRRSNDDCLFVFLDQSPAVQLDQTVLGLLLPHIDAALRRVESLQPSEPPPLPAPVISISKHVANDISFREEEIMTWVGQGKSNEEIGMILGISPNTVKNHLKKIFQKLNVSTRAQAVAKYMAYEQAA